jgi:hypothetical protein
MATSPLSQASLYPKGSNSQSGVQFQFNPKNIKVSHGATITELAPVKSGTNDAQTANSSPGVDSNLTTSQTLDKLGHTSLRLPDLMFDGSKVLANCGQLMLWSYPYAATGQGAGQATPLVLQELIFSWGKFQLGANTKIGSNIPVVITKVDVSYERFDNGGTPIRATVTLDLQVKSDNPLAQNPTSGGLPSRRGHVVVSGETLPGIALASYGRPGEWRSLAEANQLDDPLRVRPGSVLYLPARDELANRRPA